MLQPAVEPCCRTRSNAALLGSARPLSTLVGIHLRWIFNVLSFVFLTDLKLLTYNSSGITKAL